MNKTFFLSFFLFIAFIEAQAEEYVFERDVYYRTQHLDAYADSMCRLDIASPRSVKDAPVIIWFHGGGLTSGTKEIPKQLLNDGVVVVSAGYRFSPNVKTTEIIDDAAAAVAWTVRHIAQFGGDPGQVFLAGHSAGGYLASILGLDKSLLADYSVDADKFLGIVPFSGQVITHFETRRAQGIEPLQPTIDNTAPIFHVRKDCPPMLILSGDREMELYGRYEETAYFWRLMKLVGHPDVTFYEFGGFNHGSMVIPGFTLLREFVKKRRK